MTKDKLKEILKGAIVCAHIDNYFEDNIMWPVIVRSGINDKHEKIHYILHYSEDEKEIPCPFEMVEDILTGQCYKKEQSLPLKDWGVMVLREKEGGKE